jgi:hypothetical protein
MNNDLINRLIAAKVFGPTQKTNFSLAVKTIDLPKFDIKHETLNQYNRKRVIQNRIDYQPVTVTFHDDGGDNIRELWYQYYSYYYKDPAQKYRGDTQTTNGSIGQITGRQNGMDYNSRDIYAQARSGGVNDWGYIGESYLDGTSTPTGKLPFFNDIEIYGYDQHKFAKYVLINPIITSWSHDTYDYSQGSGTMQNSMTIAYETVKYYSGALGKAGTGVWPDTAHYDTTISPLSRPGTTATFGGQGGLVATAEGIIQDLEKQSVMGLIGAAQKAGTAYNTFKGKDLKSIAVAEATALGTQVIKSGITPDAVRTVAGKADGIFFPTATAERNRQATNATLAQINAGLPAGSGV